MLYNTILFLPGKNSGTTRVDNSERKIDDLLVPVLRAGAVEESDRLISELIACHAEPVIQGAIRSKLRVFGRISASRDAEDVRGEVVLRLVARLREFLSSPSENGIADFRAYAAVTAYNACHEYLRRKYPRRSSLKNTLRYVLSHQPGLAIWEGKGHEWLCGLEGWRGRPESGGAASMTPAGAAPGNRAEALRTIFRSRGGPIEIDALTTVVAEWWGIQDEPAGNLAADLPDPRVDVATEAEQRDFLGRLWTEVLELPPRQRAALLLNLRDPRGNGVIELLPLTGVATIRELAAALVMPAQEFAVLWNSLPLEDSGIAGMLGVTRQQVINLRKAARSRLARRLQY
ncbi:MAG: sigma-70 family RNA polymerase sigma factor [Acidobacteria bacterium]|nr:sigma-70 family RNA polymerase sigma factor [Acidobacteriota bacterium]